jgi:flagellar motility protein MotE (MotC chaperone)
MFILAWLTKPATPSPEDASKQPASAGQDTDLSFPRRLMGAAGSTGPENAAVKKSMTEQQLKDLVYEVRQKMQEYDNKLRSLEAREQRLQIAQDTLKSDIETLNDLRTELASTVSTLKSERDKLTKTRVEIAQSEKANLVTIAAAYDKMDPTSASQIMINMVKGQTQKAAGDDADDAVKILHFMTERTKAKVLAELVTAEPELAASLSQKLKHVAEEL